MRFGFHNLTGLNETLRRPYVIVNETNFMTSNVLSIRRSTIKQLQTAIPLCKLRLKQCFVEQLMVLIITAKDFGENMTWVIS